MKLLILSNNHDRASFRQRIGVYLPRLRAEGIECTVIRFPPNYISRWRMLKRAGEYDGVFLHKKTLNYIDAFLLRSCAKKIIYDFDDAIMYNPKKPDGLRSSHRRLFRRTVALADGVIAGNPYLAASARVHCGRVAVLPTGLEVSGYASGSPRISDGRIRLVWIGSTATLKYLKEISPSLERIGQRYPQVTLRLICDSFFELSSLPVEKCAWSLETEAAGLTACDIGLAPLPDNPFTRGKCGFKVLQYSAAGLPVAASPVGTNADYVLDGKTGLLAGNPDQWYAHLERLIGDPSLRRRMGAAGREFAAHYDLAVIGPKFVEILTDWLSNPELKESRPPRSDGKR
jgi:glycosyltransferase involved in cell wall biosynthesis